MPDAAGTSESFAELFREQKASAILRTHDQDAARSAMSAAVDAGFRIIEFTMTTPGALELIREFAARPDLVVGAGTVLTAAEADAAIDAGARFLVSPVTDEVVIGRAHERGVASMPGAFTPTEMLRAHRAGATLVKLFPAPEPGPRYVKACLGPMPFLKIVPTSGAHENNAAAFLKSGAWAVGFVNPLFDPNDIAAGRFDRIRERGERLLKAVDSPAAPTSATA